MLAALVGAHGGASVAAERSPEWAVALFPGHARATSRHAERLVVDKMPGAATRARIAAVGALERDATSVPALRSLAVVTHMGGDPEGAERLMRLAERLTRRDLVVELYAIDRATRRGDRHGAMTHYDHALRTSRSAAPLLTPMLVAATADGRWIEPLADVLVKRPQWNHPFVAELMRSGPSVTNLSELSSALIARGEPLEREPLIGLIARQIAARDWPAAALEYRRGGGKQRDDFGRAEQLVPLDWTIVRNGAADVDIVSDDGGSGGKARLNFVLVRNGETELARRMTILSPGLYRVRLGLSEGVNEGEGGVHGRVFCAEGGGALYLDRDGWRRENVAATASFVLPADCGAVWMTLHAVRGPGGETAGAIEQVVIAREGGSGEVGR